MFLILLAGDPEGPGCFALLLALLSVLLCLATLPLSLIFCVKVTPVLSSPLPPLNQPVQVVKEYERAVIFRLGRLRSGGAKVCITMDCSDNITHYMAPRVLEYSSWCLALTLTRNWTSELLVLTSRRR